MANRVSYLNSKKTFWQDIDLKNVERDFFTDGVVDFNNNAPSPSAVGSDLQVLAQDTPDKTIKINMGVSYFRAERVNDTDGNGVADILVLRFHNLAEHTIIIPDNTSGADKTFEVCCSIPAENMDAESINEIASNVGELIVQEEGIGLTNKLLLATVTVEDGFTELTQAKITDHRLRVALKAVPKGLTATVSEINLALDGILASSLDLNILENTTVTKEEFNRALTGTLVTAAELNLLNAVAGLTKADLQKLANIDATADEIDQALDGISPDVSAANLNIIMGGGFTNLHKHATDPKESGITDSPILFYLPTGELEAIEEKGILTRFTYDEERGRVIKIEENTGNGDNFDGFNSFFKKIATFEMGENNMEGGLANLVNFKTGSQGWKISESSEIAKDNTLDLNLNTFEDGINSTNTDLICFWVFIGDEVPTSFNLGLSEIVGSKEATLQIDAGSLVLGWNFISLAKSAFTVSGGFDWSKITEFSFYYTHANNNPSVTLDELQMIKSSGVLSNIYETINGQWLIEKDLDNQNQYLIQTDENTNEKFLLLKTDETSHKFSNFTLRSKFMARRGNACALVFKYQDADNFLKLQSKNGKISLVKRVAGIESILGAEYSFTPENDVFFYLKVVCDDNVFQSYFSENNEDWILIGTENVTDFTDGQIGIFAENTLLRLDELLVFEHNVGGDTFYEVSYDNEECISSITKKPIT